jgi:hypothetical protein
MKCPEFFDDNGHILDLSGEVRDISEEVLLPLSLDRLKRLDVNSLPLLRASRAHRSVRRTSQKIHLHRS